MENDIFSKLILHRGSGRRQVTRNHKFVVFVFLIMRSLVSVCLAKIKIPCKNIRLIESRHRVAGIIVYSVKENRSWKIRNAKTMMADPSATQFAVNGITISAPINIAGIALGPEIRTSNDRVVVNEDREVYFCPCPANTSTPSTPRCCVTRTGPAPPPTTTIPSKTSASSRRRRSAWSWTTRASSTTACWATAPWAAGTAARPSRQARD
jgi:hypothetical protein